MTAHAVGTLPPRARGQRLHRPTVPVRRPAPVRTPGSAPRSPSGGWEPWRDWAIIAVATHAMLLTVALVHPTGILFALLTLPMSLCLAVGTLTILHDAGHRRFALRTPWVNVAAVHTAVPIGFWVGHWGLKHRIHHKASSVYPLDEATRASFLVRFHPAAPRTAIHRYQHVYIWFLYALTGAGELKSQVTYLLTGHVAGTKTPPFRRRAVSFFGEKVLFLLVLTPYALLWAPLPLLVFMIVSTAFAGVWAALVLVVGHINEGLQPGTDAPAAADWTAYLVRSTANFNTTSPVVRWFCGGMTHHVAHHLRPMASRAELPAIHLTAAAAAAEACGRQLNDYPTFRSAVAGHARALRALGRSS